MSKKKNYMAEVQALIDEKFKDNPEGLRIAMEEAERERAKRIQVAKSENYLEKAKKEKELKKQEMKERLELLQEELDSLISKRDNFELDPDDYREMYDDFLNQCGEDVNFGYISFTRSEILKQMDETAYEMGLEDYVDCQEIEDDSTYQEIVEEIEEKESEIEELGAELEEEEEEEDDEE